MNIHKYETLFLYANRKTINFFCIFVKFLNFFFPLIQISSINGLHNAGIFALMGSYNSLAFPKTLITVIHTLSGSNNVDDNELHKKQREFVCFISGVSLFKNSFDAIIHITKSADFIG